MIDALLWIEDHPGLAGYIQAIGSIGAVAIAIWLSSWRRHALERATALEVRGMLAEASWSLFRAQFAFPEERRRFNRAPPDDDYPSGDSGPPYEIKPVVAAADVARACEALQRVHLFNLSPRCAPLISALQEALSHAAKHLSDYAAGDGDGSPWGSAEDEFERCEERAYNLILAIYRAEPMTRDGDTVDFCSWQLELAEAIRNAQPRIVRVNVRSRSVAAMWRSLVRHLRIRTTRRAQV